MFGFLRRNRREAVIERLHAAVVEASRGQELYGEAGFPDTIEGRFESLTLHALLVLRRLRALPAPAADVAQELVDSVFAHLEVAMRESGVGDVGVPKKMKKLGRAFYDRTAKYTAALDADDAQALAEELGRRLEREPAGLRGLARHLLSAESTLAGQDLEGLLDAPAFSPREPAKAGVSTP